MPNRILCFDFISVVAIDSQAPSIKRLQAAIEERVLSQRVRAIVGDLARFEQPLGNVDPIWSEGALYSIGLRNALQICYGLLRPGGYLAFTDAVWRNTFIFKRQVTHVSKSTVFTLIHFFSALFLFYSSFSI